MTKIFAQLCLLSIICSLFLSPTLSSQLITIPFTIHPTTKIPTLKTNFLAVGNTSNVNNFKGQYKTAIQVGSENVEFNVVLDTSSSKLWIPDSTTTASVSQKFDCSKSKTCKANTADTATLFYPAGNVTGYSATDKVTLQGAVIPQFKFMLAKDITKNITSYNGILGLGLKTAGQTDPTFLEALKSNNVIKEAVFSLYLASSDAANDGTSAGDITLGGYNPIYPQNPFQFAHLAESQSTPYWTLNLVELGYGLKKNISDASNIPVRIDTGSNLMVFPKSFILNFLEASGSTFKYDSKKGLYSVSCDPNKVMPDLVFYFNGVKVNISSSSYLSQASSSSSTCYFNMKNLSKDATLAEPAIIGGAILSEYYTLFAAENRTIGFAPIKKSSPMSMMAVFGLIILGAIVIIAIVFYFTREKGVQIGGAGGYTSLGNVGKGVQIGGTSNNTRPPYARYHDENQSM